MIRPIYVAALLDFRERLFLRQYSAIATANNKTNNNKSKSQ